MSPVKKQEETLKRDEKISIKRDLIILSVSFFFTLSVATFILIHIKNCQTQSDADIEKLVNKFLNQKIDDLTNQREREHGEDDNYNLRSKRAIHEFRVTNAGNILQLRLKLKLIFKKIFLDGPVVEFFDPKLRPELEKNDTLIMKKNNWKGAAPKGDNWVWMTAYSRIPFEAIDGFCKQTKEYCPPGPSGL